MTTDFGSLYTFSQKTGVIIPDTSRVKSVMESAFTEIFGSDVSLEPETPLGRLIEALTLLFVNVLGVNAQNANSFNPSQALGNYLDALGGMFGVIRPEGASDAQYRELLMSSQSRGAGFAQSIRQALSRVDGVKSICVLDNGHAEPMNLPDSIRGISVPGHSIYVCVSGGDDNKVAEAIYKTKSAGCGYDMSNEHGAVVDIAIRDEASGSENHVYFHRPNDLGIAFSISVGNLQYTGDDIVASVRDIVTKYVEEHSMNSTITKTEIATAIGADKSGIICKDVEIMVGAQHVESVSALPFQHLTIQNIEVIVG